MQKKLELVKKYREKYPLNFKAIINEGSKGYQPKPKIKPVVEDKKKNKNLPKKKEVDVKLSSKR